MVTLVRKPAAASPPRRPGRWRAGARDYLTGGPGRLRKIALLAVLGAAVLGVGGGVSLHRQAEAVSQARATSAHLVLLQGVRSTLLGADASATNAFLQQGLEPVAHRREFLSRLSSASRDLAAAARTGSGVEGAEGDAYGRAADQLVRYSGLIESARTTNRSGEPVGATYLRMASSGLRTGMLPEVSRLAELDTRRLDDAYRDSSLASLGFVASAVLGLGLLLLAQYRLARTTRRVFAVPVAVSSGVLLVAALGTGTACLLAAASASATRDHSLARATALAQARAAAFDAKSTESLILIGRGSYPGGQQDWEAAMRTATGSAGRADAGLVPILDRYAHEHDAINRLDQGGAWRQAVTRAVAGTAGSANTVFAEFDSRAAALLAADTTARELASAGRALPAGQIVIVLSGLATVIGAAGAVGSRLADYR